MQGVGVRVLVFGGASSACRGALGRALLTVAWLGACVGFRGRFGLWRRLGSGVPFASCVVVRHVVWCGAWLWAWRCVDKVLTWGWVFGQKLRLHFVKSATHARRIST